MPLADPVSVVLFHANRPTAEAIKPNNILLDVIELTHEVGFLHTPLPFPLTCCNLNFPFVVQLGLHVIEE